MRLARQIQHHWFFWDLNAKMDFVINFAFCEIATIKQGVHFYSFKLFSWTLSYIENSRIHNFVNRNLLPYSYESLSSSSERRCGVILSFPQNSIFSVHIKFCKSIENGKCKCRFWIWMVKIYRTGLLVFSLWENNHKRKGDHSIVPVLKRMDNL